METNEEVDQAAELLRALGLTVTGDDGYVEVAGVGLNLSIMRGAMIEMSRHGGTLLQIEVDDVGAAINRAEQAGGAKVALGPGDSDDGTAFLHGPAGMTIEVRPTAS